MPIITSISTQKKSGRYNIHIDNEFAFGVSDVGLTRENLHKGKEITTEDLARLSGSAAEDKLFEKALRFLAFRPRSRKEVELFLESKLKNKSDRTDTTYMSNLSIVLTRLQEAGYLDDEAFARWWVEQRTNVRVPRGERVIKAELLQKGVAREVVEKSLSEVVGKDPCLKAAESVLPRYRSLDPVTFRRRLFGFLLRRGFEYDGVKRVVDTLARRAYTDGRS